MTLIASEKRGTLCFALSLLALTLLFIYLSYDYAPGVRLFPLLVGYTSLLLCGLDLIGQTGTAIGRIIDRIFSGKAATETEGEPKPAPSRRRQAVAISWMAGLTMGIYLIGFLPMIPIYVFASMFFQGRKRLRNCAYAALGATAFIWVMFEFLLRYELYRGVFLSG
ncbi:MAG: tripartite tricarboxylate transporter TctB family protein [Rhodospirillales bacterium]